MGDSLPLLELVCRWGPDGIRTAVEFCATTRRNNLLAERGRVIDDAAWVQLRDRAEHLGVLDARDHLPGAIVAAWHAHCARACAECGAQIGQARLVDDIRTAA